MSGTARNNGIVRLVSPVDLTEGERRGQAQANAPKMSDEALSQLAQYIRTQWTIFRNHRNSAQGWNERLLSAMRSFNGQYDATKLNQIRQFQGSEVYARIIAGKCRSATALLRDVYLSQDRPWGLSPTPEPTVPDDVSQAAFTLVQTEAATLAQTGQQVTPDMMRQRMRDLLLAARGAAKRQAERAAEVAEDRLDNLLWDGRFYESLAEFLVDLPLFPYAVIKGPVVRTMPTLRWTNGNPVVSNQPKLFWERVSPFDFYFTPGVSKVEDAAVIERKRLIRSDLNDVMDLPGYNKDAIIQVLDLYGRGGLSDWMDTVDAERAVQEKRENPWFNQSAMIDCVEFHGPVKGELLLDYGFASAQIPDGDRDFFVQAWLIDRYIIKCQISPSPRKRHPYYVTSFEKVPGTVVGNALPDILADIQDVCNATARALVNNLSLASGPQVVLNADRFATDETGQEMYPWKRWFMTSDPMGSTAPPISFFQPQSNANELLMVFEKFNTMADDLSAIPRYIAGSATPSNAGRTASGLAMLMGNASKLLQTVAANIDHDVLEPLMGALFDMVMLTDTTGLLRGDESVEVKGVTVAMQKETERQRQLEFLAATANPIDMQIMGPKGRSVVLRSVANTLGIEGQDIVPSDDELEAQQKAQAVLGAQQQAMAAQQQQGTPAKPQPSRNPANQARSNMQGMATPATTFPTPGAPGV